MLKTKPESPDTPVMRIEYWIGIVTTLLAVSWPFAAVCLSAHQLIYSETERWTSLLCFLGVVFGPVYCLGQSKPQTVLKSILVIAVAVLGATAVFNARIYSDKMFTFWKLRSIPNNAWQQMVLEIDTLARQPEAQKELGILKKDIPRSFGMLGRLDECWGASIMSQEGDFNGVRVVYGNRNRKWGLIVGSKAFLDYSSWSKFRRIPVATNAEFFIGPDW